MVERMVKIVKQILTMYMDPSHTNWDEYLQSSIAAYNTSKQASLKISPYEALYARDAVKVSDVMLSTPVVLNTEENVDKYTENLRNSAAVIHAKVNVQLEKARQVQKHYYDRAVKNSRKYEIGDLVSVVNERSISGQSHAFKDRAIGPFKIVGVFNDKLNYQILGLNDNKINKIHYNRLLPYKARENNSFVFGKNKTTVSEVSKTPSSRVNVELARSTNSNEFDVDVDFIIS